MLRAKLHVRVKKQQGYQPSEPLVHSAINPVMDARKLRNLNAPCNCSHRPRYSYTSTYAFYFVCSNVQSVTKDINT
ncbi:hypothetical protein BCT30_15335 [Enterovibrio norvegicus]|uniref:Uncharacterized protein n=1 Tax=Enterovibrio norvegicus TaxID=188144 RepID=A0A2N7LF25_9GAMM|nr:hypothetical protein BCU62_08400 [Enterovibrio norvegicus]PMI32129.1 hypothetical protein BCU47_13100 [Enterovibrio norvegicus]PMI37922.1 hypothetical protein BCU46_09735 [Enterovibrio norvegicus]PML76392.1 hypothetical protein BCT69_23595 [Enterovibrio norvegicus]PMN51151.1 hypothetical protein BCT30_15335 [Enterovibrio norvegicus]